jgi:hypothetical protein
MTEEHQGATAETQPESHSLTAEVLRQEVHTRIERLSRSLFTTLQQAGTESLMVYLVAACIEPILRYYSDDPPTTKGLVKKIWPTSHAIFERYVEDGSLDKDELISSVQVLLDTDASGTRVFENILIFADAIPLMEEYFHRREWVLQQLRGELRTWHRTGRFQRLDVTIPSEQIEPPAVSRGDLQVQVSASKPTIVAGQEFSVFVVINNPFDVPIILYSVETQIPVELIDIVGRQIRYASLAKEPSFESRRTDHPLRNSLRLIWDRWQMRLRVASEPESRIAQAVAASELDTRKQKIDVEIQQTVQKIEGTGQVIGAQFQPIAIAIDSASPTLIDNLLWRIEAFKRGLTPIVLQPGDSVVKQFIFRTKSWLFFTPLAHTMQIQVRYGVDDRDHLDTVHFQLSIQAAITATMVGAVIGGAVGGIARLLSDLQAGKVDTGAQVLSLLLAVILSAITVVSFARKSGVQQIISIEDFWGGLFIGFLIGFLGQNYALDLITPQSPGGAVPTLTPTLSS